MDSNPGVEKLEITDDFVDFLKSKEKSSEKKRLIWFIGSWGNNCIAASVAHALHKKIECKVDLNLVAFPYNIAEEEKAKEIRYNIRMCFECSELKKDTFLSKLIPFSRGYAVSDLDESLLDSCDSPLNSLLFSPTLWI